MSKDKMFPGENTTETTETEFFVSTVIPDNLHLLAYKILAENKAPQDIQNDAKKYLHNLFSYAASEFEEDGIQVNPMM